MAYIFDNDKLMKEIDEFVANNEKLVVRDIKTLVDIPSVEDAPQDGAPFGINVNNALITALEMANAMNLQTCNMDGYFGYADLIGDSDKQIATIAHLDVVPAGNGWDSDPFGCIEKEGYLIGRGVHDNKGPAVLTLYAAKFFKERAQKLPYTLRIMLGTNEESGMQGLNYYLKHEKPPEFCFTPDGNFPVGFGEKGLYSGTLYSDVLIGNILQFEGGVANNVVPDRAFAVLNKPQNMPSETEYVKIEDLNDGTIKLNGFGIGGHASIPEGTINAIALLVKFMLDNNLCTEKENEFLNMLYNIISDTTGKNININATDDIFTPLTCVGGVIKFENNIISQTFDIRYPTSITAQQITQNFNENAKSVGAKYEPQRENVPFVTSANSKEVIALCQTYNEIKNKNDKPFTMGGGTYARHFPRAVSFGPHETKEVFPSFVGTIHGANEGMKIEELMISLKIYILSIAKLMQIEY